MLRRLCFPVGLLFFCLLASIPLLLGQAAPTAYKAGGLQVGAGYINGHPDYTVHNYNGLAIFGDVDVFRHFGVEAEFHRISSADDNLVEHTYEIGGRYRYPIRRFEPYLKILAGRGTFTFEHSYQNGGYAMYAGGGGLDVRGPYKLTLRLDYEYQHWGSFPPRGLQPNLATVGVAYRFR